MMINYIVYHELCQYIVFYFSSLYVVYFSFSNIHMNSQNENWNMTLKGLTGTKTYLEQGNMIMNPLLVQAGAVLPLIGRWNHYLTVVRFHQRIQAWHGHNALIPCQFPSDPVVCLGCLSCLGCKEECLVDQHVPKAASIPNHPFLIWLVNLRCLPALFSAMIKEDGELHIPKDFLTRMFWMQNESGWFGLYNLD